MAPHSLRNEFKHLAATLACASGATRLARARRRQQALILTYHGVLPSGRAHHPFLSRNFVDQDAFARQMRHLRRHYQPMRLRDVVHALRHGTPLPRRAVVVTFDDGFRNNGTYACPVLRDAEVPATIFLATGHIGQGTRMLWTERVAWLLDTVDPRLNAVPIGGETFPLELGSPAARETSTRALLRRLKSEAVPVREAVMAWLDAHAPSNAQPDPDRYAFLDWDEVRAIAAEGVVDFGSHTVSHLLLATGDRDHVRRELAESRDMVARHTGTPCTLFAYPNGTARDFTPENQEDLQAAGYVCAVSQIPGFNAAGTDLYALRRFNVGRGHTMRLFDVMTAGLLPVGAGA